ncbi:alpha-tectorin-like, partial [Leuresthes tenuis]|uniref:alpha-tectorin-like n=1 Tax=Leuresthes tenuis TaxID=355514 RepID=UPI003B508E79
TVIDFAGRGRSVPDRCGYRLLRSPSLPGLQVVGVFKERRRRDTGLLDSVILQLDREGVEISLNQGSIVQLDDEVLTLSATAQLVHGVELSKDQTGVTARMTASNHTVTVLFDGDTTIIHVTGSSGATLDGFCGDSSTSLSQERVSKHSATDCETKYAEPADSAINCNSSTEWCNRLQEAPFTACSSYVDPQPFIDACTQTLCKYPPTDGLKCHFLEAYTKTCRIYSNVTAEGWRSTTGCSIIPQAVCREKFCSDHEFCGEDGVSRETRCLCRAIFASKYKPMDSFGEPVVCGKKSASLTMANCLLENKGIDYSLLHLNDQSCTGEMDNVTHMVTFGFNSDNTCGTVIMANTSHIIHKNTIMTQNISTSGEISRHDVVKMDFSCYYAQPDVKSLAIKLRHSSVIQHISSGEWNYTLTMEAYTDPNRRQSIDSNTEILLNEKLWVELKAGGLDESIVAVVTDSCWATNRPSPDGSLRYNLIINGCPNPDDHTVKVEGNGLGTSNYFSFNTFQFSGENSNVYLHCKVELCIRQSDNCIQRCSQSLRERRSAKPEQEDDHPAFITMTWTY